MEHQIIHSKDEVLTRRQLGKNILHGIELASWMAGISILSKFLTKYPIIPEPNTFLTTSPDINVRTRLFLHRFFPDIPDPAEMNQIYPNFCIRNDNPDTMQDIASTGIGLVRIAGPYQYIGKPATQFEQAIRMAEYAHLRPLVVFAPVEVNNPDFLRTQIQLLVTLHPSAIIELGNEPDVNVNGFNPWKATDTDHFHSFAEFVKLSMSEALRVNPKTTMGIGALQNLSKTPELLNALKNEDIPLQRFNFIALHAYNSMNEVQNRTQWLHSILQLYSLYIPIWMTELGIDSKNNKALLPNLIDQAYRLGVQSVCLHEFEGVTPWAIDVQDISTIETDALSRIHN